MATKNKKPGLLSRIFGRKYTEAASELVAGQSIIATMPGDAESVQEAVVEVAEEWSIGDVILDLYEVLDIHTGGGMGLVYKVHHREWDIDLAVKSPRAEFFQTQQHRENFVRECETWIDLGLHPHTISCHYVRMLGRIPRVFAEYVEGGSLKEWIDNRKLYMGGTDEALQRILDIAIQFAWGLQYAHEQDVIHQDVKPANVMLTEDGIAKVTDFGLANARAAVADVNNTSGNIQKSLLVSTGGMTPAYCSPEQASAVAQRKAGLSGDEQTKLTKRTDIWSWAVSVLEMFTGKVTWMSGQAAGEALETYLKTGVEERDLPNMPDGLVEVLRYCFQQDESERPKDFGEVVVSLLKIYEQVTGSVYPRLEPSAVNLMADALNNKALSLLDLGKEEEAEQVFDEALHLEPHHSQATYNRGLVRWRAAKITDDVLVKELEEVRASNPERWIGGYLLGLIHLERGNTEAALEVLNVALEQTPDNSVIKAAIEKVNEAGIGTGKCIRTFEGHTDGVTSVSFSPDGSWALSGSTDGTLRLWDVRTGECMRAFEEHTSSVNSVSFSPDGRWALLGSIDCTARLWDISTGKCIRTFEAHTFFVDSVCISPDSRWGLSASFDKTLRLWELDWDLEFPDPADWDDGALPYLVTFLTLHCPYGEDDITQMGKPVWTDDDFNKLITDLQYRGYGWLRPEGVRRKLEQMTRDWKGPPPLPGDGS